MSDAEIDTVMSSGTSEAAVTSFLDTLDAKLAGEASTAEGKLLAKMGIEWMKKINLVMKVPIAPRNAQFISMLACCKWASHVMKNPGESERALVAQVGTGEGKSLIIAMSAIYAVKLMGKRVHILTNNAGLLNKDYSQFKDLFATFGISVANNSDFKNLGSHQVTYCLSSDLLSYYRDAVFIAVEPFANTILIVDEVDQIIVDDKPNTRLVSFFSPPHSCFQNSSPPKLDEPNSYYQTNERWQVRQGG